MIPIDFKKYIASVLRSTRWGEFMEAYQSLSTDLIDETINPIIEQYQFDNMDITDFKNILTRMGFDYSTYEGYTAEIEYFKKQAITLVIRILQKTTRGCWKNEFYIFYLYGDAYPIRQLDDNSLIPFSTWWEDPELPDAINILDSGDDNILFYLINTLDKAFKLDEGQTLDEGEPYYDADISSGFNDAYLDTVSTIRTLDQEDDSEEIIRSVLLQYKFNRVENTAEFLSTNTMRAFYNDCMQFKRLTEEVYFEPTLEVNYKSDLSMNTTTYYTFDKSDTASQQAILIADSFTDLTTIRLGNGGHSTVDNTITDVVSLTESITDFVADEDNPLSIFRKTLLEYGTTTDFTEIALWDSAGTCFLYAKFPAIRYHEQSYSNIKFEFNAL